MPRHMIPANDILEAANDNPPQPIIRVYRQHLHIVGQPTAIIADVDVSQLAECYRQRGHDA